MGVYLSGVSAHKGKFFFLTLLTRLVLLVSKSVEVKADWYLDHYKYSVFWLMPLVKPLLCPAIESEGFHLFSSLIIRDGKIIHILYLS